MKKLGTLLFIMVTMVAFGQNQLPNSGLENWSFTSLYENPEQWTTSNFSEGLNYIGATKDTNAFAGNFALRLENGISGDDTLFSFGFLGEVGEDGPSGGVSYTSPINQIEGRFWHELPPQDTAIILVIKYLGGNQQSIDAFPITGHSGGWLQFLYTLNGATQDEIFIGLLSGNALSDDYVPTDGAWIMFDEIELSHSIIGAGAAVPNGGFENWEEIGYHNPDGWTSFNPILASFNDSTLSRSTDAANGMYAARLETKEIFQDSIPGALVFGQLDDEGDIGPASFSGNPSGISFQYKYSPSGNDSAGVFVQFFSNGQQIGGVFQGLGTAQTYQMVSLPVLLIGTPDSAAVVFFSGDNAGSVLFVDEPKFTGGNVGLLELEVIEVNLFPNPAKENAQLKFVEPFTGTLELVDIYGRLIFTENLEEVNFYPLSTANYPAGNYTIRVQNEDGLGFKKLIIIK